MITELNKGERDLLAEIRRTGERSTRHRMKILAVASSGGHWVQLRKLATALEQHDVAYLTVKEEYRAEVTRGRFYRVCDGSAWTKTRLLRMSVQILAVVLKERPNVVISTGAAPGVFALMWSKLLIGSRTIWLDSVANSEQISSSGRQVRRFADLWLTQWQHLAGPGMPQYAGRIL